MENNFGSGLALILGIAILGLIAKGAIKTFQRNWIAALLLLIVLTPIWVIWAFIELFTGQIKKSLPQPISNNQSVNVTLVHQADGTTRKMYDDQFDIHKKELDMRIVNEDKISSESLIALPAVEVKECPFCAETVRQNAIICRYCNRDI